MHSVLWLNKNSKRLAPEKNPHLSTQATTVHKFYLRTISSMCTSTPPLKQNRASLRRGRTAGHRLIFFPVKGSAGTLDNSQGIPPGLITHFFFQNIARFLLRPVNLRNDNDMGSAYTAWPLQKRKRNRREIRTGNIFHLENRQGYLFSCLWYTIIRAPILTNNNQRIIFKHHTETRDKKQSNLNTN